MLCDYQLNSIFCLVYQSVVLFSSYPHNQSPELRHNIHPLTFNYPGLSHGGSRVFQMSLFPLTGDAKAFPNQMENIVLLDSSGSVTVFFPDGIAWKTPKGILSRCPNHLSGFHPLLFHELTQMTNVLILSQSLLVELISEDWTTALFLGSLPTINGRIGHGLTEKIWSASFSPQWSQLYFPNPEKVSFSSRQPWLFHTGMQTIHLVHVEGHRLIKSIESANKIMQNFWLPFCHTPVTIYYYTHYFHLFKTINIITNHHKWCWLNSSRWLDAPLRCTVHINWILPLLLEANHFSLDP